MAKRPNPAVKIAQETAHNAVFDANGKTKPGVHNVLLRAVEVQRPLVLANLRRLHRRHPQATAALDAAPLFFAQSAPNAGILSGVDGPLQAVIDNRAPPADRLGLLHLQQGRTRGPNWEEQLRVFVAGDHCPPDESYDIVSHRMLFASIAAMQLALGPIDTPA